MPLLLLHSITAYFPYEHCEIKEIIVNSHMKRLFFLLTFYHPCQYATYPDKKAHYAAMQTEQCAIRNQKGFYPSSSK